MTADNRILLRLQTILPLHSFQDEALELVHPVSSHSLGKHLLRLRIELPWVPVAALPRSIEQPRTSAPHTPTDGPSESHAGFALTDVVDLHLPNVHVHDHH